MAFQGLDVVISMVLIYASLSVVCSGINEVFASLLALRARTLKRGLQNLLNDPHSQFLDKIYDNPLVRGFTRSKFLVLNRWYACNPTTISAETFVDALLDTLKAADPSNATRTVASVREAIQATPLMNDHVKKLLLAQIDESITDYSDLKKKLANWYDTGMDKLTLWYKRQLQFISLGVAALVTVGLNVDTLALVNGISSDMQLRGALVSAAAAYAETHQTTLTRASIKPPTNEAAPQPVRFNPSDQDPDETLQRVIENVKKTQSAIQEIPLPIGWKLGDNESLVTHFMETAQKRNTLFGWLFSIIALSMGAPFWYALLNQLVNIRPPSSRSST